MNYPLSVQGAVQGVSEGFTKKLEIQGVGSGRGGGQKADPAYWFRQVEIDAPEGIDFKCPDQTHIEISGVDKQLVGQVAANIRAVRKPEP